MGCQRPAHPEPRLQRKWLDDFTALGMREPQDELFGDADRQKARAAASVALEIAGRSASASSSISKICLRTASKLSSTVSLKSGSFRSVNLEAISARQSPNRGRKEIPLFHGDMAPFVLDEVANDVVDGFPQDFPIR